MNTYLTAAFIFDGSLPTNIFAYFGAGVILVFVSALICAPWYTPAKPAPAPNADSEIDVEEEDWEDKKKEEDDDEIHSEETKEEREAREFEEIFGIPSEEAETPRAEEVMRTVMVSLAYIASYTHEAHKNAAEDEDCAERYNDAALKFNDAARWAFAFNYAFGAAIPHWLRMQAEHFAWVEANASIPHEFRRSPGSEEVSLSQRA